MWELDCEESWVPKNWCFWTVVLEKTLESLLDCKDIQPVHSEGDQSWDFFGRNDAKAETPVLWPPHGRVDSLEKSLMLGGTGGRRRRGWQRMRWLDGITDSMDVESEWTSGLGDGQGGLACCDSWGRKESDTTERLNWTERNTSISRHNIKFSKAKYPFPNTAKHKNYTRPMGLLRGYPNYSVFLWIGNMKQKSMKKKNPCSFCFQISCVSFQILCVCIYTPAFPFFYLNINVNHVSSDFFLN